LNAHLAGVLAKAVAGSRTEPDSNEHDRLHQAFQNEGISTQPTEVLHRKADRTASNAAIPSGLWGDALLLALRMASNHPDWSICSTQDDYPSSDPTEPLQMVVQELEELVERARGSLIGSAGRNASVQEVCNDFLADLKEAAQVDGSLVTGSSIANKTVVSPPEGRPT
ncbi:hypothetical protein ACFL6M_07665, partial [Candidatus Eisenbacteria bacterium]